MRTCWSKPNDVAYNGVQWSPASGEIQTGGWASPIAANGPVPAYVQEVNQGVPAQVCVTISGTDVAKIGAAANQFQVRKSLANGPFQIYGHVTTASGADTDNAVDKYVYLSRNNHVCTISQAGVITPVGRGQTVCEVRYSRAACAPYTANVPSPTESMAAYASLIVTIVA